MPKYDVIDMFQLKESFSNYNPGLVVVLKVGDLDLTNRELRFENDENWHPIAASQTHSESAKSVLLEKVDVSAYRNVGSVELRLAPSSNEHYDTPIMRTLEVVCGNFFFDESIPALVPVDGGVWIGPFFLHPAKECVEEKTIAETRLYDGWVVEKSRIIYSPGEYDNESSEEIGAFKTFPDAVVFAIQQYAALQIPNIWKLSIDARKPYLPANHYLWHDGKSMQETVNELLNQALENGYDMSKMTPEEVAEDMVRFSSEVEQYTSKSLIPFINVWQAEQQMKGH